MMFQSTPGKITFWEVYYPDAPNEYGITTDMDIKEKAKAQDWKILRGEHAEVNLKPLMNEMDGGFQISNGGATTNGCKFTSLIRCFELNTNTNLVLAVVNKL